MLVLSSWKWVMPPIWMICVFYKNELCLTERNEGVARLKCIAPLMSHMWDSTHSYIGISLVSYVRNKGIARLKCIAPLMSHMWDSTHSYIGMSLVSYVRNKGIARLKCIAPLMSHMWDSTHSYIGLSSISRMGGLKEGIVRLNVDTQVWKTSRLPRVKKACLSYACDTWVMYHIRGVCRMALHAWMLMLRFTKTSHVSFMDQSCLK